MKKPALAGAILVGIGLWGYSRQTAQASIYGQTYQPETLIDEIMATLQGKRGISAMKTVDHSLVNHPQIRAFFTVIRKGEGTPDAMGYNRLFGGEHFMDFSRHPNRKITKSGYTSTAAGAYQFLKSTWDETAKAMNLPDFSPLSQDIGALGRLAFRGAIDAILTGDFERAIALTNKEWASLPGSPYGQPVVSYQAALSTFKTAGGKLAA